MSEAHWRRKANTLETRLKAVEEVGEKVAKQLEAVLNHSDRNGEGRAFECVECRETIPEIISEWRKLAGE